MKVLLTGSTSQQANSRTHRRSANFMGLFWEQLRLAKGTGVDVQWLEPSVSWGHDYLSGFDHVVVGLASPMSMGANRLYGALSVLERMAGSPNLTMVLDAPDPGLVTRGLRSVFQNWDSFTKPFFSYRAEYDLARNPVINSRLRMQALRLLEKPWPRTVVPGLPWTDLDRVEEVLPEAARGRVRLLNLDHLLLDKFRDKARPEPSWRVREWSLEGSPDKQWVPGLHLGLPVRELRPNHRIETDNGHAAQLARSIGLLVSPHRLGTWWTPKIAMSLAAGTPVFADWRAASDALGPDWGGLPGTHELSTFEQAEELARQQLASYVLAITHPSDGRPTLAEAAGMKIANRRKVPQ